MAAFEVRSQITGIVIEVIAKVGEQIGADETIMLLESMKMEIELLAPRSGVLAEVLVEVGNDVSEGQIVARIE